MRLIQINKLYRFIKKWLKANFNITFINSIKLLKNIAITAAVDNLKSNGRYK